MGNILGFFPLLVLILSSINLGSVIHAKLKLKDFIPQFSLGFFIILGVFQLLDYFFVILKVNTKLILIFLLFIMICSLLSPLFFKVKVKLHKKDYIKLFIIVAAVTIFSLIASNYGLGEKSDSVFYLSMVNENSVSEILGNLGYRGNEFQVNPMYAYQSFYHIFSMLIKFARQIVHFSFSPIFVYFWGAQILFYLVFFDIITSFAFSFFCKKPIYLMAFIVMSLYLCSLEGFIYLAFIGNQWRVLCISVLFSLIYQYSLFSDESLFVLIGSLISSLLAVSSSGLYMSIFIAVGFWFVLVKNNTKRRSLFIYLLSLLSLVIYTIIVVNNLYGKILAGLIFLIYILLIICIVIKYEFLRKLNFIFFVMCFIFLIGYSFIYRKTLFPYSYFFIAHQQDMCNHYFSFYDMRTICFNLTWIFCLVLYIISKIKAQKISVFEQVIIMIICLFLNPLVMPAIIKYLTDFVYYRSYDILFNIFTVAILLQSISKKYKNIINLIMIVSSASIFIVLISFWSNLSLSDKHVEDDFNKLLKLNENEIEVVKIMQEEASKYSERPWVVSQLPYLKGYVNGIQLRYGVADTRNIVKYSDRSLLQSQPSELMNIFIERDYIGQFIFKEAPNYDKACNVLAEKNVTYIILKTNQYKEQNGTWVPIWLDLRACSEVVGKNEEYVILRRYEE